MSRRLRLAIITTHPIQYQVPIWRGLAREPDLDLTVFFASDMCARAHFDPSFGCEVKWDRPMLDGYTWKLLENRPLARLHWRFGFRCPSLARELAFGRFRWTCSWWARNTGTTCRPCTPPGASGCPCSTGRRPRRPHRGRSRPAWPDWQRQPIYEKFAAFLCVGQRQRAFYQRLRRARGKAPRRALLRGQRLFPDRGRAPGSGTRGDPKALTVFVPETRVIAFAGKFIPKKRPLDLVKAFERLPQDRSWGLLLAGSGPLESACRAYVQSHGIESVVFAGFQNQGEIGRIYAAADCFVLPSDYGETWGLVVNEAMNFGLPIVVSDRVGCGRDLVREGENGFTFRSATQPHWLVPSSGCSPTRKLAFVWRTLSYHRCRLFDRKECESHRTGASCRGLRNV